MVIQEVGTPLSIEIYNTLKERIIRWEYPPNYRFTENELSEEFGVSRSPIREALQMLAENDLVIKVPYRGYTIRQPNMAEINELYDVRLAIESYTVERLALLGVPEDQWKELYATWINIKQNLPSITSDIAQKDEVFHETLARWAKNQTLLNFLQNVNQRLHFIRMTDVTNVDRLRDTCDQHLLILKCIKEGDVQCAREAIAANIEGGRKKVAQAVMEALSKAFENHRTFQKEKNHNS